MNVSPECGDQARLKRLLVNDLGEVEQAEVVAHLDTCAECQRSLESLAAGRQWWDDLHQLARKESLALPGGAGTTVVDEVTESEAFAFLAPSDYPGALGRLGIYEVVAVIGRGGFARVFKALDPTLNRMVAIKVLAPALASSATARLRFAREARAAAAVAHEHIVAIHAVDSMNGLPYIVMQYVPGRSLQDRIDESGPLGLAEILRIGAQTALGLAAAHAQGLIHRDIKPANILLENCVERVKLTDFGLARAVDDASLTQNGVVAGTPEYMAPEQARGKALDARTDLFSLGSVLYAMSTGYPPFRAETSMAVLHRVCEDIPRSVRALNPEVPAWLEAIIGRLHAKDPAERFGTAAEVATLLNDCLAHVQDPSRFALPRLPNRKSPGSLGRARSWESEPAGKKSAPGIRRWVASAAAAVFLALGALGAAEAMGVNVVEMVATVLRIPTRDGTLVVEVEDPDVKVSVDNESDEVTITGAGIHEVRLRPGKHQLKAVKDGKSVMSELIAITRGGKQVVRVNLEPTGAAPAKLAEGAMVVAKPADSPALKTSPLVLETGPRTTWFAVFSPDGMTLATGGRLGVLKLWDLADGRERSARDALNEPLRCAAFSPDGKTLATGRFSGTVTLWDPLAGAPIKNLREHADAIRSVCFSPDGKRLVASGVDRRLTVWETATWTVVRSLPEQPQEILCSAISPDSTRLAVALGDPSPTANQGGVTVYQPATRDQVVPPLVLSGLSDTVWSVAFSPDGKTLVTSGRGPVRFWDPDTGRQRSALDVPHHARIVAFSPDGKTLLTAGAKSFGAEGPVEGMALIWDLDSLRPKAAVKGHGKLILGASFSPDGRLLATATSDAPDVRVWEIAKLSPVPAFTPQPASPTPGSNNSTDNPAGNFVESPVGAAQNGTDAVILALAYSPDGRLLATAGEDKQITLRDSATRAVIRTLSGHTDVVAGLAFSPDGLTLASASHDKTARLWNVQDGEPKAVLQGHANWVFAVAYSPDGKTLATASYDKLVKLWDVAAAAPNEIATFDGHGASVRAVAFSPDRKTLASGGGDRTVRLWDVAGRSERASLKGHKGTVRALAFSSDGALLATAADDDTIKLWDTASGNERASLTGHTDMVLCLAFDPQSRFLASGGWDTMIKVWDVTTGKEQASLRGHTEAVAALAFSPSGGQFATGGYDKRIRLWATANPPLHGRSVIYADKGDVWFAVFAPDGRTVATGGDDQIVRLCDSKTGQIRATLEAPGRPRVASFSPDGKRLAIGYSNGIVDIWDLAQGKAIATLSKDLSSTRALAFSPDGRGLAVSKNGRSLVLYNTTTWEETRRLAPPEQPILSLAYSPDGMTLAIAAGQAPKGGEGWVKLLDATSLEVRKRLPISCDVWSLAYSPDGKFLATSSQTAPERVQLWDVSSSAVVRTFQPQTVSRAIAYAPDGATLAVAQNEGTISLWEPSTGRLRGTHKGHARLIFGVAFSPDGTILATASQDGTARLWDVPAKTVAQEPKGK